MFKKMGKALTRVDMAYLTLKNGRFCSKAALTNWALYIDEGTLHIHERHVFEYENRYGELYSHPIGSPVKYIIVIVQ